MRVKCLAQECNTRMTNSGLEPNKAKYIYKKNNDMDRHLCQYSIAKEKGSTLLCSEFKVTTDGHDEINNCYNSVKQTNK